MSEKTIDFSDQSNCKCVYALSEALRVIEKTISERNNNKMSAGKMSAVARELKELIKVVINTK